MVRKGRMKVGKGGTWAAALLFLLLAAVTTWPRLPGASNSVVDYGDPFIDIWRLRWIGQALTTNPLNLYEAPIFHGYPLTLAYDDIVLGPALVALAVTPLTGSIELTYNLLIVASFALSGWCLFLLARHLTRSPAAALVGGVAFAFWSYTFAHISHITSLSLYPIPLALLCLHLYFRPGHDEGKMEEGGGANDKGGRVPSGMWLVGLTACFIWQTMHSFYYAAYLALMVAAWVGWEMLVIRRWRAWTRRQVAGAVASLAVVGIVCGAALLAISAPYREAQARLGFHRPQSEQAAWSARLTDYVSASPRNQMYDGVLPSAWPEPLFPGFLVMALALVGIIGTLLTFRSTGGSSARNSRLTACFYILVMIGAMVLSLGPVWEVGGQRVPLPYRLLAELPGFSGLRAPARFAVLAALGAGIVAAYGWVYLTRLGSTLAINFRRPLSSGRAAQAGVRTLALSLAVVVLLAEQWTVPTPSAPLPPSRPLTLMPGQVPDAYEWLARQNDRGVLAELPILVGLQDPTFTYTRMYYQGLHRRPLLNGHSSFIPPTYPEIAHLLDEPLEITGRDVGILQSLEVRYLLFYRPAYKKRHWAMIKKTAQEHPELARVGDFGEDTLYTVAPLSDEARLQLSWSPPPEMRVSSAISVPVTITNVHRHPLLARLQSPMPLTVRWERRGSVQVWNRSKPAPGTLAADWPITGSNAASAPLSSAAHLDLPPMLDQGTHRFTAMVTAPPAPGRYRLHISTPWRLPHYRLGAPVEVIVTP